MKQIRRDIGSGAYYSQLGQTDIVFQGEAFLYFEKLFVLFYFGLLKRWKNKHRNKKQQQQQQQLNRNIVEVLAGPL